MAHNHQSATVCQAADVSGGLFGLLDDIAALAKLTAASIDDVSAAAGRASVKAAGVVVDDTAVTPAYVHGLAAQRELPIIGRIAKGSLRNKLVFILPVALVLSSVAPTLVEVILMLGGTYLGYEGAHKIHGRVTRAGHHEAPAETFTADHEEATVRGAIRTDLILSAEIMVIALKEVLDQGLVARAAILVIVAVVITALVYGVVALIVKIDDIGLALATATRSGPRLQRLGRTMVVAVPRVLGVLSVVGTAAMCWVGGHILINGAHELGWHWPHEQVHHLEESLGDVAGIGGVLGWLVATALSAGTGIVVGAAAVLGVTALRRGH